LVPQAATVMVKATTSELKSDEEDNLELDTLNLPSRVIPAVAVSSCGLVLSTMLRSFF
jgi:hypothetical protein